MRATSALTVTAGETGPIAINTQSILGFSGQIALGCGGTLPVGVTCASTIVEAGGSGTLNLITTAPGVITPAASTTASASHSNSLWAFPGGITVAGLILICIPRRGRFLGLWAMLIALGMMGGLAGCSGTAGVESTSLVLTSANTKVASGARVSLQATVEAVKPLTGTVTFYGSGTIIYSHQGAIDEQICRRLPLLPEREVFGLPPPRVYRANPWKCSNRS